MNPFSILRPALLSIVLCILTSLTLEAQFLKTPEFEQQHRNIIKLELFSPLMNHVTVGYERYLQDFISMEGKIGLIGVGMSDLGQHDRGAFLKAGVKFKLEPETGTEGPRTYFRHLLNGKYAKPELILNQFSQTRETQVYDISTQTYQLQTTHSNQTSVAFVLNIGKQWIMADRFSIDLYAGAGFGTDLFSSDTGLRSEYPAANSAYRYSHTQLGKSFPLALTSGWMIGYLFR